MAYIEQYVCFVTKSHSYPLYIPCESKCFIYLFASKDEEEQAAEEVKQEEEKTSKVSSSGMTLNSFYLYQQLPIGPFHKIEYEENIYIYVILTVYFHESLLLCNPNTSPTNHLTRSQHTNKNT